MGDQTIRPQNQITFGGVKTNQNDIASKRVVKENGATRFVIDFKNGTTVKYPAQAAKNHSEIADGSKFERIAYAEITTNKDGKNNGDDIVFRLDGCKNCTVDTSQNNLPELVIAGSDDKYNKKSSGNKFIQGEDDRTLYHPEDIHAESVEIRGAGTHIEGQENNPL